MKKCSNCKIEKNSALFSKNRSQKDGLQHRCKECSNACGRAYLQNPKVKCSKAKYQAKYMKTDKGKVVHAKSHANYRANNPYKIKAKSEVGSAIRNGSLIRPTKCSECSESKKIEAHHDDYNKSLEVRWLCRKCHKAWHKDNQAIEHIGKNQTGTNNNMTRTK